MRTAGLLCGCAVAVGAVVACSGDKATGTTSEPQHDATVVASADARFSPGSVNVPKGAVVLWRFQSTAHNVTFNRVAGAPADIDGANANTSVTRAFPSAGTFAYQCTLHPGMSGTISVREGSTPPPEQPPPGGGNGYP